jgi:hypothetical protein
VVDERIQMCNHLFNKLENKDLVEVRNKLKENETEINRTKDLSFKKADRHKKILLKKIKL